MPKSVTTPKFKRNNSFYIREGWFEKALQEIDSKKDTESNIFSGNSGVRNLGIGSAMVTSLKNWLTDSELICNSGNKIVLTEFGKLVLSYDPYLESNFVWFLIHYNLTKKYEYNPVGNVLFNSNVKSFRKQEISILVNQKLNEQGFSVKPGYIEDDLNIVIKSYVSEDFISNPEDNYVCPLANLGLIKKTNNGYYEKTKPSMNLLSYLVIYYCIWDLYGKKSKSFNIEDSYKDTNSPCYIFNLDKNSYLQYLDAIKNAGLISISKTAGLNVVYFDKKEFKLNDLFSMEFD